MTALSFRGPRLLPVAAALLAVVASASVTALDGLPLLLAGMLGLVGVALAYRYPARMFLLVLAVAVLVPVDLAPKLEPLPRLGPTRALLGAFITGWVAHALVDRRDSRAPTLPLAKTWIIYVGLTGLGVALSIEPMRSLFFFTSLLVEQLLLFYVVVHLNRDPEFERAALTTLAVVTVAVSAGAVYESVTQSNPIFLIYPWETTEYRLGLLRVRSTFFHPIALGTFLTLVLPFLVVDATTARGLRRIAVGGTVLLAVGTSVLTFSRGPWFAQAAGFGLLLLWWAWGDHFRLATVATAGALLIGGVLLLVATIPSLADGLWLALDPNRLREGGLFESSSEYYRIALFEAVFARLHGSEWLYGLGPGTFYLADVESTYAGHQHVLAAADSQLAKLLLEQGLLGTGAFLALVTAAVVACVRALRQGHAARAPVRLAALAAVIGFLIANLTVSMFFLLPLALLFWMAIALALGPREPGIPR